MSTLTCRPVDSPWWQLDAERVQIEVPEAAADQIDALPLPECPEVLGQWEVVLLDGSSVEVADAAGRRWRIRRGQCSLGSCCCDLVAWPADRREPVPAPEVFDAWYFHQDSAGWDALEAATGLPVGDMAPPELLAVVEAARAAGAL